MVIAVGSTVPRDLPVPGRELKGIHQAMEFLPQANRVALGEEVEGQIRADGKHVVIIGGGDTGADCLGTSIRQGAASITQPGDHAPADGGPSDQPAVADVPDAVPGLLRARGGRRPGLRRVHPGVPRRRGRQRPGAAPGRGLLRGRQSLVEHEGTEREIPADLVLFAMGFVGPEQPGLVEQTRCRAWTSAATSSATRTTRPTFPASSSPVTRAAASRSSCGRSRRAGRPPPVWTPSSPAAPSCPPRSRRRRARWWSEAPLPSRRRRLHLEFASSRLFLPAGHR
nr:hypothetical protein [Nocardioides convexus]